MKVSFVLLAHEKPEQLKDLLGSLLNAGSNVYVHHDATTSGDLPAAVARWGYDQLPGKIYFSKRVKVVWGEWSIVQATLNCMEAIQQHDTDSDYFMLISGSCMPIKPIHLLEQYLAKTAKDHIEAVNAEKHTWVTAGLQKQRWSKYHFFNWRYQTFLFDTSLKIQRKLKIKRVLPLKHTAHMGSQWWCLRRSTLDKIWSLYRNKPILKRFYRRTWVPDELFFQTIVANLVPEAERSSELMTRYTFNGWGVPRVYYDNDYAELLGENRFFIRKVSHRAAKLRAKLTAIAPMQVDEFATLLEAAEPERLQLQADAMLAKHIELNRWHSLAASLENPYDYIKSIPNPMLVLIGSDREAKAQALSELDRLDQTIVYGDLFDKYEVGAGYANRQGLIAERGDVELIRHRWYLQLGDIAHNNPGKTLVFSLGANALEYLEVLRWNSACHMVMVDRNPGCVINIDLMSDLYLKSKVLHLLLDRHCELSRVSTLWVEELTSILQEQQWSIRSFNRMLINYQEGVRWPSLLTKNHNYLDFLESVYSKVIVLVYVDKSALKEVEYYLNNALSTPLYHDLFSVIPDNDNTLDWHYYLADVAHLNARLHTGVLAMAIDISSIKHLETLRWKKNLLVISLEDENAQFAIESDLKFSVYGKKDKFSASAMLAFRDVDILMKNRSCDYIALPSSEQGWIEAEINEFLQFMPLKGCSSALDYL
ncbi:hypothetical protein HW452_02830 [Halomonas aquamarina]|uniref:Uncharacterized protein n=1 Tax=Vreelandella aquamarina TaxID=77097 RepID=A0ACC5VQV5_9GAMM|nr:beta-1,6-N-acetylglucosaminyltransferase [Halomonas aquamarina]MBZ5486452.1 hypothetical protein [Halomonas aquamarina]